MESGTIASNYASKSRSLNQNSLKKQSTTNKQKQEIA